MNIKLTLPGTADVSLAAAQSMMAEQVLKGSVKHRCPCCGRRAQIYPETISTGQVRALIWLRDVGPALSVNVPNISRLQGRFARMAHYGLISKAGDGWVITRLGIDFLGGTASIPRHVYLWDGRVVGVSEATMTIHSVKRLDLSEVLGGLKAVAE